MNEIQFLNNPLIILIPDKKPTQNNKIKINTWQVYQLFTKIIIFPGWCLLHFCTELCMKMRLKFIYIYSRNLSKHLEKFYK